MSLLSVIKVKLGQAADAARNFIWDASAADGTLKLLRENGQQIITVDAQGRTALLKDSTIGGNYLGDFSNYLRLTGESTLTLLPQHRGSIVQIDQFVTSIVLPAANSVPAGASFKIYPTATGTNASIISNGSDSLVLGTAVNPTNRTIKAGETIELISDGSSVWYGWSGFGAIKNSAAWLKSLSTNGYQILPSGLIIQWGQLTVSAGGSVVTFPIAFPNMCFSISGIVINATVYADVFECGGSITASNFNCAVVSTNPAGHVQVSAQVRWIAIGY